ncbi:hypothetical protein [Archangium sp.]|uniref:hypothetical protein n=1 Tax=Archangium sp. TaxID=1872627 RepID=UPI002D77057B|nr:hypothetical protein [Archangium sp.]
MPKVISPPEVSHEPRPPCFASPCQDGVDGGPQRRGPGVEILSRGISIMAGALAVRGVMRRRVHA